MAEEDMEAVDLTKGSEVYDHLIAEGRHVDKPYDVLLPPGEHYVIPVGTPLMTEGVNVVLNHGQEKVIYVIKKNKENKYIKKD